MLGLLLALAVGQFPDDNDDRPPVPTSLAVADLEMERACEEFAMRAAPARPPEPYLSMIGRLGAAKWKDRVEASKALEAVLAANPADRRWLWWGRKSADHEIALRCNALIRRLTKCEDCEGTGIHPEWNAAWGDPWADGREVMPMPDLHPHSKWHWGSSYPCCRCGGEGHLWPRSQWD